METLTCFFFKQDQVHLSTLLGSTIMVGILSLKSMTKKIKGTIRLWGDERSLQLMKEASVRAKLGLICEKASQ